MKLSPKPLYRTLRKNEDFSARLKQIAREIYPGILNTPTLEEQAKMVVELSKSGDKRAIPILAEMLCHKDKSMRILVIESIKKLYNLSDTVRIILEQCLDDENLTVRECAQNAINECKNK